MNVSHEQVVAGLSRRVGEDAVTIAAQAVALDVQAAEITRLRGVLAEHGIDPDQPDQGVTRSGDPNPPLAGNTDR